MPFKSEKQRSWMWANKPKVARRWANEEKSREKQKRRKKPLDMFEQRSS